MKIKDHEDKIRVGSVVAVNSPFYKNGFFHNEGVIQGVARNDAGEIILFIVNWQNPDQISGSTTGLERVPVIDGQFWNSLSEIEWRGFRGPVQIKYVRTPYSVTANYRLKNGVFER